MRLRQRLTPWAAGALTAAAMFAALWLATSLRYENSDDMLLVKAFMGFEGEPTGFTLYTHTLLAWVLRRLSLAAPTLAWFSLFQLALLWFSCVVIVKSMMQIAASRRLSMLWGLGGGCLYLGVFAAFACCRVTYTTTAALAGAAAAAQVATIDFAHGKRGRVYRGFALALALLAACYSLRQIALLPPLAFVLLVMLWRLAEAREEKLPWRALARPFVACACAMAVILGGLAAMREVEIDAKGQRDFLRWYNTRCSLYDYLPFEQNPEPALAAGTGLSQAELTLMREWYLMDANVTEEALATLREAYVAARTDGAAQCLRDFLSANPRYPWTFALCALLAALCLALAEKRGAAYPLAACLAALGGAALILYLAVKGRVIFRSADSALFPCAATLLALALEGMGRRFGKGAADSAEAPTRPTQARRAVALLLCLLCVAAAGGNLRLTQKALSGKPDSVSMQREAELEAYALAHPDTLLARTPNLLRDTRLFPDVSAGVPDNIVIWGDWYCRTPGWNAQLARFGFDAARFTATDWLSDRIRFVTADERPPEALAAYIAEGAGRPVRAELTDEYGTLRVFRFTAE